MTEWLNALEVVNSRATNAEEWISELEYRMMEITAAEQNKEWKEIKAVYIDKIKCTSVAP